MKLSETLMTEIVTKLKPLSPEKIILLGSYAYGEPREESDIDLLVVTSDDFIPQNYQEKNQIYLKAAGLITDIAKKMPIDLIVHTKKMHQKFIELNGMFCQKVRRDGVVLYMKTLTREWLQAAKDDLDVAHRLMDIAHLTHMAAFHAQQCVEKVFKAVLEEGNIEIPKIHNLITLYGSIEDVTNMAIDIKNLQSLDELYIAARYPGELGLLPNGKPTVEDAQEFYQFARDIYTNVCNSLEYQQ